MKARPVETRLPPYYATARATPPGGTAGARDTARCVVAAVTRERHRGRRPVRCADCGRVLTLVTPLACARCLPAVGGGRRLGRRGRPTGIPTLRGLEALALLPKYP